jgi:tellurite resistance protein TehA-like permease
MAFLAEFFPGYFALVMATGIVSLGANALGFRSIAVALFAVNVAAYIVLWGVTLSRLAVYPRRLVADLTEHARGPAFLTIVAGTCVLGSQFGLMTPWMGIARALWYTGVGLWVGLVYAFFSAVTVRDPKPTLEQGLHGGWLVIVVATESLAVLGAIVAPSMPVPEYVLFVALAVFLVGSMLYGVLISLILYRWMFFRMSAEAATPTYWINMGAVAITTLAGSRLLLAADSWAVLGGLRPFLLGTTLLAWSAATWWIPLLVIVGIWRHGVKRVPLAYDPIYWSLVFPLGMYTTATLTFVRATGFDFLSFIPRSFVWIALAAWTLTFAGMVRAMIRAAGRRASGQATGSTPAPQV